MLASLANRAKLSPAQVKQRMLNCLRGCAAESHGEIHPGADTIN
jgi:hypothetical protein